ncbi:oxidoreductase [Chitinophaga ginsengisoli]|uniref:NADP-dependent 3-hydroxy acid dehydrogenase YdfG n=1 Tax=Chitinophaga ginsengisoli TaxID=363837 RepID=A0A2P8FNQ4_9BACT|nr:oxidoreductase [Chitinophaga ginsengisoli]PSL23361.1 NADP-dependent 3-hydroxy acid dehydrogenase YdfG [Chitinophaga ginsengisoli]
MKTKVWFITGASRGFGLEIAKAALANGDKVVATVRSQPEKLQRVLNNDNLYVVLLDVTNEDQARQAARQAVERFGRIDVLVNNAGFGLLGAVEEASDEEVRQSFDTNVFGLLHVTRAILPYFRAQHSGHVINLSSVVGLTATAGWGLYAATKFAVEGINEALAVELKPLGIHVTAVEPGFFRTNFLDGSSLTAAKAVIADYQDTAGQMRAFASQISYKQPGDPVKLANAVMSLAASPKPPVHLPLGNDTLNYFNQKMEQFNQEIEEWRSVTTSTDHEDVKQNG